VRPLAVMALLPASMTWTISASFERDLALG
jgi:hypothetical protein